MSSTVLVLTVLPCFMVIVDDLKGALHYLWHGLPRDAANLPDSQPQLAEAE